jgi:hypothetical protein
MKVKLRTQSMPTNPFRDPLVDAKPIPDQQDNDRPQRVHKPLPPGAPLRAEGEAFDAVQTCST